MSNSVLMESVTFVWVPTGAYSNKITRLQSMLGKAPVRGPGDHGGWKACLSPTPCRHSQGTSSRGARWSSPVSFPSASPLWLPLGPFLWQASRQPRRPSGAEVSADGHRPLAARVSAWCGDCILGSGAFSPGGWTRARGQPAS